MQHVSNAAMEARARRAAKKVGLRAIKTRWRKGTADNYGGFQLLDPWSNWIVEGYRFDLSPEDVLQYCCSDSN